MIRVYTASKLRHGLLWREKFQRSSIAFVNSRWLQHDFIGTPDSPDLAIDFWVEDEEDVKSCDALVVYAAPEDHLRGALVEVGMAIAYGKPIIALGDHSDYGTWRYHPQVINVKSWDHLLIALKAIDKQLKERGKWNKSHGSI